MRRDQHRRQGDEERGEPPSRCRLAFVAAFALAPHPAGGRLWRAQYLLEIETRRTDVRQTVARILHEAAANPPSDQFRHGDM
jgi:hypothetical protein